MLNAHNVEPDQTPQNAASDQTYIVCLDFFLRGHNALMNYLMLDGIQIDAQKIKAYLV